MSFVDHYGVLGVPRTASSEDIKRAYRAKARETHPDLNPNVGSDEPFKAVGRAFEVLGDPKSRAAYDSGLPKHPVLGRQWTPTSPVKETPRQAYLRKERQEREARKTAQSASDAKYDQDISDILNWDR